MSLLNSARHARLRRDKQTPFPTMIPPKLYPNLVSDLDRLSPEELRELAGLVAAIEVEVRHG